MSGGQVVVGIDVGTSGVKAVAVSPQGRVVAQAKFGYELSTPQPGWAEQDPEDWWHATELALGSLTEQLGGSGRVVGVGLSGQMHGLVCLDAEDEIIRPAILWNDQRTYRECAVIEQAVGLQRLVELTGNRMLPGFTAPKLLWLRRHEPASYERIRHVLLPKDYVRLRLTGEKAVDVADASGTLLFDVARRAWSNEVLQTLEIPADWLPRTLESTEVSGVTLTGVPLPAGIPVAAGAGDQQAGALGVGVVEPGPLSVVLGTSGVVLAALDRYAHDREARAHTFCHAVPNLWEAMGVMLSAAGSLRWLRDAVAPGVSYEELTAEAGRWEPGAGGLLFQPYLQGERTPHADPHARGAFVGLSLVHDRGALVRAVLEGVAYGLRDSLELLREAGAPTASGRISGGGARSRLWIEIVASVLGLPLELTAVEEGAAFGAALLGGVAAGIFRGPAEAVQACVVVGDRIDPNLDWQERYEHGYARYRALYPALRPLEEL
jgi:xylulokinase